MKYMGQEVYYLPASTYCKEPHCWKTVEQYYDAKYDEVREIVKQVGDSKICGKIEDNESEYGYIAERDFASEREWEQRHMDLVYSGRLPWDNWATRIAHGMTRSDHL